MKEALLCETGNTLETYLYEEILKQNDIPYIVKQKGIDGYMKILSPVNKRSSYIYVNGEDLEKALELTNVISLENEMNEEYKKSFDYKKKSIFAWIISIIFLSIIFFVFISSLINGS